MNRFLEGEISNKKLPPIGAYWQHSLLPIEQALEPVRANIDGLDRSIKEAKRHCCHPSPHQLTKDESAAIYLYTMEGGDNSFYRILNEALRSENRRALRSWFGFLKLFDTALSKLPAVKTSVWRGISGNISQQFKRGELLTWWSISSCSVEVDVVQDFLGKNINATLLMIVTKSAKDVSRYTSFPDEKEVILGPGTQLRVKGNALQHGTLQIVHLVEVSDDDGDDQESLPAAVGSMTLNSQSKNTEPKQVSSASAVPVMKKPASLSEFT
ncbi:unnamed protein product [Adineta ricciae]|uniref:NAD(P)(+)--arginine ADP-ribosyltransferase n=1 Tax=Adineta ricciae TaxID=249248 RepID=A0A815Z1K3_ADIRI|nr:unnamed protein product [Adineta ricciae]